MDAGTVSTSATPLRRLEAEHLCTQMRGVREEHSKTVGSFWRGGYTEQPELRREFLEGVRSRNPWS